MLTTIFYVLSKEIAGEIFVYPPLGHYEKYFVALVVAGERISQYGGTIRGDAGSSDPGIPAFSGVD
jgi:hypothetical protein